MAYDNNNSGALFKNERKTMDKQPDYTGKCMINGTEFWISAWIRESKQKKKFMSLAFNLKEGGQGQDDSGQDDIPF